MNVKHKRVLMFMEDTQAGSLVGLANAGGYSADVRRALDAVAAINATKKEPLKKRSGVARMLMVAEISTPIARLKLRPLIANLSSTWLTRWEHSGDDVDANTLIAIISAANTGTLDRFSKCVCGQFFMRQRKDQRFHAARCREKQFKSSEDWKAHRREYMKEYYRLKNSGKVK